jgi:hypothetical protein
MRSVRLTGRPWLGLPQCAGRSFQLELEAHEPAVGKKTACQWGARRPGPGPGPTPPPETWPRRAHAPGDMAGLAWPKRPWGDMAARRGLPVASSWPY